MSIGVVMVDKDGCKEMQGEDIVAKELVRGAIDNEMNEDLWIQLAAIEKKWTYKLESMKIDGVVEDAKRKIVI